MKEKRGGAAGGQLAAGREAGAGRQRRSRRARAAAASQRRAGPGKKSWRARAGLSEPGGGDAAFSIAIDIGASPRAIRDYSDRSRAPPGPEHAARLDSHTRKAAAALPRS